VLASAIAFHPKTKPIHLNSPQTAGSKQSGRLADHGQLSDGSHYR